MSLDAALQRLWDGPSWNSLPLWPLEWVFRGAVALRHVLCTIYELVVAGNPTMRDLLFGIDVQSLCVLPYRSVTEEALHSGRAPTTSLAATGRKLRLPVHPDARVYGLPLVGSHVGADGAACLLATGLAARTELRALLDIGTNTEVFLGNGARLVAASCPAGPAFEGGGVSCGMPALGGAIERVRMSDDGTYDVRTVSGAAPIGICGSGLVDLLAELRRTLRMNEQGRFLEAGARITLGAAPQFAWRCRLAWSRWCMAHVIFDLEGRGGTILSTEDLFEHLARAFRPQRISLAGIEAGVWEDFPVCTRFIHKITPANFSALAGSLKGSAATDVTGGMESKVAASLKLVQEVEGLSIQVFSGDQPGAIFSVLAGAELGTVLSVV